MKNKFLIAISLLCSVAFWSCTDLDEKYYSEVNPSEMEDAMISAGMYPSLLGDFGASPRYCPFWLYVYTVQASTDELAIPACGQQKNWLDQGIYVQMMQHHWTADNPIFESCWSYFYKIASAANFTLKEEFALAPQYQAEGRLLRAYAYYNLMDLFGNVPIIKENNGWEVPRNSSRAEVFRFVESELNDPVMDSLQLKRFAKMDKGVLHTLKARLYLNSKVFLGLEDGSEEYNAYLEKCIAECDSVINSGQYSIAPNIYSNFYFDNGPASSPENIFVIQYNNDGSTLGNRTQMTSYYKTQDATFGAEMYQHTTGGWKLNPGKTADDPNATFNIFSKYDNRRLSILWGQQYDRKTKQPIKEQGRMYDKDKNIVNNPPINYTPFFDRGMDEGASAALEKCAFNGDGARIIKFELEADPQDYESGVDMVVMRYAEVLYMKAEALIRLGRGTEAIPLFKEVLQHRGYDYDNLESFATTIEGESVKYDFTKDEGKDANWACALMSKRWLDGHTGDIQDYDEEFEITADLEFMDQELRREFIWENHRRTDMIRMGKFIEGTWGGHLTATQDPNKLIFPIPTAILRQNPKMVQNPGY